MDKCIDAHTRWFIVLTEALQNESYERLVITDVCVCVCGDWILSKTEVCSGMLFNLFAICFPAHKHVFASTVYICRCYAFLKVLKVFPLLSKLCVWKIIIGVPLCFPHPYTQTHTQTDGRTHGHTHTHWSD